MPSVRQIAKAMEPICCYSAVLLTGVTRSIEHVVPLCRLEQVAAKQDLNNVYACDIGLNIKRSAYRFIEVPDKELIIDHKLKAFIPSNHSKGLIARTCLYMQQTHDVDLSKVIDEDTLNLWLSFDVTDYETRHSALVSQFTTFEQKKI